MLDTQRVFTFFSSGSALRKKHSSWNLENTCALKKQYIPKTFSCTGCQLWLTFNLYSWITWITRVQNKCNFDYINLTFLVLDLGCEVSICTVGLLPSPEHVQLWLPPVSNGTAIRLSHYIIKNWAILFKIPFKQPCFVPTNSCLSTTGIGQNFDAEKWSGREEMSRKKRTIIAKNLPNSNKV